MKVAVLEDNKLLLEDLIQRAEATSLVKVLVFSTNANDFIEKVQNAIEHIDAILVDIELENDSMTGLDVATILKKPVLFVSGKTREYLAEIECVKLDFDFPVDFLLKPVNDEKLKRVLLKFLSGIQLHMMNTARKMIEFKFNDFLRKKDQNSIVFIESITNGSNNKKIYFTDDKPIDLFNFSFSKMPEKGYDAELFIESHQSYRINKNHIIMLSENHKEVFVNCMSEDGVIVKKSIPIAENNRSKFKNFKH